MVEPIKQCNLRCRYCYSETGYGKIMSRKTLQISLENAARYAESKGFTRVHILWQGGEPLLAGLEFFLYATRLAAEISPELFTRNFLQTNGLLLNEDFCSFFREHNFQIGLSLDAFAELHDSMRVFPDGTGSHNRILEKVNLARENNLRIGFNTVVNRRSLGHEREIYRYFQSLGAGFRVNPMIPVADPEQSAPFLLRQGEYGFFLCRLFEEWINTEVKRIPVSPLDLYLKAILDRAPCDCQHSPSCVGTHLGVKPSGDAVLCSRFESESHILGNIKDLTIDKLFASPLCEKIERRAEMLTDCHSCINWAVCHGGCPHNAIVFFQNPMARDYFCKDYQLIFGKLRHALVESTKEETSQDGP